MSEYLAPGVYLEEVSYRTRSIEGVSTTTAAFVGPTRSGPLHEALDIITNLSEYERVYGDGQQLVFENVPVDNYVWQAVRAFFENGGSRLYVQRVFNALGPNQGRAAAIVGDPPGGLRASARYPGSAGNLQLSFTVQAGQNALAGTIGAAVARGLSDSDLVLVSRDGTTAATLPATARGYTDASGARLWRFDPGGSAAKIELASLDPAKATVRPVTVTVSATAPGSATAAQVWGGLPLDPAHTLGGAPDSLAAVFGAAGTAGGTPLVVDVPAGADGLAVLTALNAASAGPLGPDAKAGTLELRAANAAGAMKVTAASKGKWSAQVKIEVGAGAGGKLLVTLTNAGKKVFGEEFGSPGELVAAFAATGLVTAVPGTGTGAWPLTVMPATALAGGLDDRPNPTLISALIEDRPAEQRAVNVLLQGGDDGRRPAAGDYAGALLADDARTGLVAFEVLDDVSIVAAPGCTYGYATRKADAQACINHLISHAQRMRYRIAVIDSGDRQTLAEVREMRAKFDASHAALYYPWLQVSDPVSGLVKSMPPSGAVAGIYARNDAERGVHKAPANEVVRLALDFERVLSRSQQEVLNPEGINCLRTFPGRGNRVWGARTMSSDQEWKYVNVRRYFAFLEHSIERGTQWAVFEPNGERLWASVRGTIEDFLLDQWQAGALQGDKPDKAYFVRCDRSTMTQNDLDNGRIVCQIGVAPVRPAEFVIFRIGQWTADRKL
jgi:phage tail sheath protein FI